MVSAAIYAIVRRVDVRLALLLAALALGSIAGQPMAIVRTFLATLSNEQFVVPICCAMGFAHVLRHTQCDQHLVHLLVKPMQKVRGFLVAGTVLVGFLVNIPVISQTSTAVAIGSVVVPLLRAARISAVTTGAALLLGSSLGGELLNPGAPELRTVSIAAKAEPTHCVERVLPLLLIHLGLTTTFFWLGSFRAESKTGEMATSDADAPPFQVNIVKALVPLLPLALLFLTGPPLNLLRVPEGWLVDPDNAAERVRFQSRLIGAAMLVGVAVASLISWRTSLQTARAFFDGAGYAFTHIISLIVTAACFGEGVKLMGLKVLIANLIDSWPALLLPIAGALPLAFACLCGSGMAATQSLFGFFLEPARSLGMDPVHVGAVISIGAAAGRTMSPVAAVALMCASITDTNVFALVKRVALPLLVSMVAVVIAGAMLVANS